MRLLDLSVEVQKQLSVGDISVGHAKVILSVKSKTDQTRLANQIIKSGLTVRAAEKLVGDFLNPGTTKGGGKKVNLIHNYPWLFLEFRIFFVKDLLHK